MVSYLFCFFFFFFFFLGFGGDSQDLPNTNTLPAPLCEIDQELIQRDVLLRGADPALGVEGVGIGVDGFVGVDEVGGLADWGLVDAPCQRWVRERGGDDGTHSWGDYVVFVVQCFVGGDSGEAADGAEGEAETLVDDACLWDELAYWH